MRTQLSMFISTRIKRTPKESVSVLSKRRSVSVFESVLPDPFHNTAHTTIALPTGQAIRPCFRSAVDDLPTRFERRQFRIFGHICPAQQMNWYECFTCDSEMLFVMENSLTKNAFFWMSL